jgi:hypothetical protein
MQKLIAAIVRTWCINVLTSSSWHAVLIKLPYTIVASPDWVDSAQQAQACPHVSAYRCILLSVDWSNRAKALAGSLKGSTREASAPQENERPGKTKDFIFAGILTKIINLFEIFQHIQPTF